MTRSYGSNFGATGAEQNALASIQDHVGMNINEQHRPFIEASAFATLKRGGPRYNNEVEVIAYKNGELFQGPPPRFGFAVQLGNKAEMVPYKILTIQQGG